MTNIHISNLTPGISCPEGPGGRCSPDLYKWTCIQNNLWEISSDYGTGSQDAGMFPVVSVPGPQTHGTSLVSILIVTLAKFARASVNLSCWRSLTPLGVNVTSPAHLQVSEEETAMPAPRPSHCRRLGEGSSGCSGTIFSTRANSWELTSTKPLSYLGQALMCPLEGSSGRFIVGP